MVDRKTFGKTLWRYRNLFIIALPPLLLLPLPMLISGQESLCGYIMLIMAIYWCTEALPLAVTGMIPIFVLPMLGILKSADVAALYMKESTMMFMGGLMVAIAFQRCNLHKRIALSILVVMGVKPIWLMLGFMMPTWLLSMWTCNTATTVMMLPILEAVLVKLGESMKEGRDNRRDIEEEIGYVNKAADVTPMSSVNNGLEMKPVKVPTNDEGSSENIRIPGSCDTQEEIKEGREQQIQTVNNQTDSSSLSSSEAETAEDKDFRKLCKGMTLAIVYSANIGGIATINGSTTNVVMKNFADDLWMDKACSESPVNFSSWMIYSAPTAIITVIIAWLWLALFYLGPRGFKDCCSKSELSVSDVDIKADIKREYHELGKMKYEEWLVLFVFLAMVLLWFFSSPGFMTGWADVLQPRYIDDSAASLMCTVALFVIPMRPPRWGSEKKFATQPCIVVYWRVVHLWMLANCYMRPTAPAGVKGKVETLLNWETIHKKYPWSIIFLIGGGFAIAEAAVVSGLSDVIGEALMVFDTLPPWFMVFIISLITSLLTEVTSNSAACSLIMPIVANMAEQLQYNPLYLMFPSALATSFSFMLPVSSPPNAVAFTFGHLTVLDMVKAGAVLKLTVFVLALATETWGMAYFDFKTPAWDVNSTSPCLPLI